MKEFNFLLNILNAIYKRPGMYGSCVTHTKSVVKQLVHICFVILDSNWTYDLTTHEIQKSEAQNKLFDDTYDFIESVEFRLSKWGNQENDVRESILEIYSDIWKQVHNIACFAYTSKWIDFLLSNPAILRSPNEVDNTLNVLFRVSLGNKANEFVTIYNTKVTELRGSSGNGLHNWNVSSPQIYTTHIQANNQQSFEDIKQLIVNMILTLENKKRLYNSYE
ncbi:MAG TPA: hypothetical protein VLL52_00060 [Anaerolineae bacterium]|nr:hypothetical protein [Anaerolineae bacterium]